MRRYLLFLMGLVFVTPRVVADEGMWMLPLIKQLNMQQMTEMGLKLTAEEIYSINNSSLKDAIMIFDNGCTAEMVSGEGLLLTNHHCGYESIQYHSAVEHDYLTIGFWAMTREEELPTPGLTVTFLKRIEDVTEKILPQLNENMNEDDRDKKVAEISSKLIEEAIKDTHYEASVEEFFEGNIYYLYVYETFKDVRLVGTPPSSIGKFGDDTDNWMWPRHTGDFSIFRVYCDAEGKPAEYSEKNVPYKPIHFLPISMKGIKEKDFTMILGYPGSTTRYLTSYGITQLLNIYLPNMIKIRGERQKILMEDMMASKEIKIKYASKYTRSSNYWKYSIGQNKRLKDLNVFEKKRAFEDAFTKWVAGNGESTQKYANVLDIIQQSYVDKRDYINTLQYISECFTRGTEIIGFTSKYKALEAALSEKEKDPDKLKNIIDGLKEEAREFYKDYNAPTDRKVAKVMFSMFRDDIKKDFLPDIFEIIATKYNNNIPVFIDKMFEKSIFADQQRLEEFLALPDLKKLNKDMAYLAAKSITEKEFIVHEKNDEYNNILAKGERLFISGIMEMEKEKTFYPDANFTMRLTYGNVGDYKPRDAVKYDYYTTLKGVMEKEDPNNWEFEVPAKLKELYEKKNYGIYGEDGVMKLCFITNNDITGGNSGSPVMNAEGELLGLAFDGNWEAMSGDIAYENEIQKCIAVDIRYVLFIIDKFAGAKHLVDEMKLVY